MTSKQIKLSSTKRSSLDKREIIRNYYYDVYDDEIDTEGKVILNDYFNKLYGYSFSDQKDLYANINSVKTRLDFNDINKSFHSIRLNYTNLKKNNEIYSYTIPKGNLFLSCSSDNIFKPIYSSKEEYNNNLYFNFTELSKLDLLKSYKITLYENKKALTKIGNIDFNYVFTLYDPYKLHYKDISFFLEDKKLNGIEGNKRLYISESLKDVLIPKKEYNLNYKYLLTDNKGLFFINWAKIRKEAFSQNISQEEFFIKMILI